MSEARDPRESLTGFLSLLFYWSPRFRWLLYDAWHEGLGIGRDEMRGRYYGEPKMSWLGRRHH